MPANVVSAGAEHGLRNALGTRPVAEGQAAEQLSALEGQLKIAAQAQDFLRAAALKEQIHSAREALA